MSNSASSTSVATVLKEFQQGENYTATEFTRAIDEVLREEICRSKYAREHFLLNRATGEVREINCKSPRCPRHAGKWVWKWQQIVSRETEFNPVDRIITLTCASHCEPAQLNLARQLLFRKIRKEFDFEYFSVLEFTSRTRLPHLHILARCNYIPQASLSELWRSATQSARITPSPVVYIQRPYSQKAASIYVLSYVLSGRDKHQDIPDTWRGRKVSYSKNFFREATTREHWIRAIEAHFGENAERGTWEVRPAYQSVGRRMMLDKLASDFL